MEEITIGYLTWKKNNVLEKSLKSHLDNGLYNIIKPENRFIFFQESNYENDIIIANKYCCNYIGNIKNVGILNAFIELIEKCNTKYFIFCENDFLLLEPLNDYSLYKCFEDIINILNNDDYAQVKLSNIKTPGFLYCTPTDINKWQSEKQDNYSYKIESLSWIQEPEKFYDCLNVKQLNNKWFFVSSNHQKWSNHIYICNTFYLKNILLPIIKYICNNNNKIDVLYQGLEDILNDCFNYIIDDENIRKLVNLHKNRTIYSGGGNFFHNK